MSAAANVSAANIQQVSHPVITVPPATVVNNDNLNALLAENEEFRRREALYRTSQEETDALMMRSPLTASQAYGYLGLFLGAFPPAAIFIQMGGYGFRGNERFLSFGLFFIMNAICMLVGWKMGKMLGDGFHRLERSSWNKMILGVSVMSLVWAGATGFAGGAIIFIFGGLFGAVMAMPVAVVGFLMFSIVHRLMERGGLIERAHVLPLVFGISMTIGAFILSNR